MMMELIQEFIKPELLILIPVMYIIGTGFKKSKINDALIPSLLGIISIALSLIYVLSTSDIDGYKDVLTAIFSSITQGVLVAGCSVYFNQLYKQTK